MEIENNKNNYKSWICDECKNTITIAITMNAGEEDWITGEQPYGMYCRECLEKAVVLINKEIM